MTPPPSDHFDSTLDRLLDHAIDSLRRAPLPEPPRIEYPLARVLQPKSRKRSASVVLIATSAMFLMALLLWSPSKGPRSSTAPDTEITAITPAHPVAPKTGSESDDNRTHPPAPSQTYSSGAGRPGLILRTSIVRIDATHGARDSASGMIDQMQSQVRQLDEIFRRSHLEDRAQQLMDELKSYVAASR